MTHAEGYKQAEWVLLDYVDFVVHIFSEKARHFTIWNASGSPPSAWSRRNCWQNPKRAAHGERQDAAAAPKKTRKKKA